MNDNNPEGLSKLLDSEDELFIGIYAFLNKIDYIYIFQK
jgi:hypothetical protein